MINGRCECGGVDFAVKGARNAVTICHCTQCRRMSGHAWASTHAPYDQLRFISDDTLTWYASSSFAKRGFCRVCGASLFYHLNDEDGIGIAAGCLDAPTGLHTGKHIYVAHKGDYYEILGDAPLLDEH